MTKPTILITGSSGLIGSRLADRFLHLAAYYDFAGEPSLLYEEVTVPHGRRQAR